MGGAQYPCVIFGVGSVMSACTNGKPVLMSSNFDDTMTRITCSGRRNMASPVGFFPGAKHSARYTGLALGAERPCELDHIFPALTFFSVSCIVFVHSRF
jgi:hypothetical protein